MDESEARFENFPKSSGAWAVSNGSFSAMTLFPTITSTTSTSVLFLRLSSTFWIVSVSVSSGKIITDFCGSMGGSSMGRMSIYTVDINCIFLNDQVLFKASETKYWNKISSFRLVCGDSKISDRVKLLKDQNYEAESPHQCQYVVVNGIKTKFRWFCSNMIILRVWNAIQQK